MCTKEYKADINFKFENFLSKLKIIYNDLKNSFG